MTRRLGVVSGLMVFMLLIVASPVGATGERASGRLIDNTGQAIGSVRLTQTAKGVLVQITVTGGPARGVPGGPAMPMPGVPPGVHGVHLYEVGRCDGPDFLSAGGHFNPDGKQHGFDNPRGPHAGDLPNWVIDSSTRTQAGSYDYAVTTTAITLTNGPTSIFDANGTALIINATADDYKTDPDGNSGRRIACAVLTPTSSLPALPNTGAGGRGLQSPLPAELPITVAFLVALVSVVLGYVRSQHYGS